MTRSLGACLALAAMFMPSGAAAQARYFQYDADRDVHAAPLHEIPFAWILREFLEDCAHEDYYNAHVRLVAPIDIAEAQLVIDQGDVAGVDPVYFCNKPGQTSGEFDDCKGALWTAPLRVNAEDSAQQDILR